MVKTRCSSGPRPAGIASLTHDEVVQNLVDPRDASHQTANVEIRAVLEHPLEADPVRDPADDQSRKAKFRMGEEVSLDSVFEAVRGLDGPMCPFLALAPQTPRGRSLDRIQRGQLCHDSIPFSACRCSLALLALRAWPVDEFKNSAPRSRVSVSKNLLVRKNLRRDAAPAVRVSPTRRARPGHNFVRLDGDRQACIQPQKKKPVRSRGLFYAVSNDLQGQ